MYWYFSWSRVLQHIMEGNKPMAATMDPTKLKDKERQHIKDRFKVGNQQYGWITFSAGDLLCFMYVFVVWLRYIWVLLWESLFKIATLFSTRGHHGFHVMVQCCSDVKEHCVRKREYVSRYSKMSSVCISKCSPLVNVTLTKKVTIIKYIYLC